MEYTEFDYLYSCVNCGKLIEFSEYIKNNNCCDSCTSNLKEKEGI